MVIDFRLLKNWPNTYTFTKAIAENVVREFGKGLPIAVVRPSIGKHRYSPL
jgi:fatty acyl-CoA reductase